MSELLLGAAAGCLATVPMTWTMATMYRALPPEEKYPLPPREITQEITRKAEISHRLDEAEQQRLALVGHFAMGTACGIAYSSLGHRLPLAPPVARGALFGLAVWAGNYLGLLPALNILRPATEHPRQRTSLMIASHLVWGVATEMIVDSCAPKHKPKK